MAKCFSPLEEQKCPYQHTCKWHIQTTRQHYHLQLTPIEPSNTICIGSPEKPLDRAFESCDCGCVSVKVDHVPGNNERYFCPDI
jgi:hypothetical protein